MHNRVKDIDPREARSCTKHVCAMRMETTSIGTKVYERKRTIPFFPQQNYTGVNLVYLLVPDKVDKKIDEHNLLRPNTCKCFIVMVNMFLIFS